MDVLVTLLAVVVALLLPALLRAVWACKELVRVHWLTRGVPGPQAYPLIGNLAVLLAMWSDIHEAIQDIRSRYGGLVRLWALDRIALVVMDAEDVEVVCTHPALQSKAPQYDLLNDHLGSGLINMRGGPEYRRHRKAISPSLHLDILQDFVPIFAKNATKMAKALEDKADSGRTIDAAPLIGMVSSQSITETVLSTKLSNSSGDQAEIVQALEHASQLMMWRCLRPWWASDWLFRLSSKYHTFKESAAAMHRLVFRILHQKSEDLANGVQPPPRRRMAFLDHVLRSAEGVGITKHELNDELKTFLFVGSTSSMDFLSTVAVILSLKPDMQAKIQQELDEIYGGDRERAVVPEDLPHMNYLERVLKEALRYAPPAPMFFREASADVKLPSGHLIPRSCLVCLLPGGTHRDPRYFPDPECFDPDRFLPENCRGRHPFAYIPFSAGLRNCIGQRYAMMFAKTTMATILRRLTFVRAPETPSSLHELKVDLGITMTVRGGALVRIEKRRVIKNVTQ